MIIIKQDADTATALRGLILLAKLPGVDDYPEAGTYRRQSARYLEDWTHCVAERLETIARAGRQLGQSLDCSCVPP